MWRQVIGDPYKLILGEMVELVVELGGVNLELQVAVEHDQFVHLREDLVVEGGEVVHVVVEPVPGPDLDLVRLRDVLALGYQVHGLIVVVEETLQCFWSRASSCN